MQNLILAFKSINKKQWEIIVCAVAGCICGWSLREIIKQIRNKNVDRKKQNETRWLDGWKAGYMEALKARSYEMGFKDGYNQAVDDIDESENDYQQGYYDGITQNLEYPDDINEEWV